MSKAVEGLAELGGAVAVGAAMFVMASTGVGLAAMPLMTKLMLGLAAEGIGTEIGAMADAIGANQSHGITTRQPAEPRQLIYGTRRVGGQYVYLSSTGSSSDQWNAVIVLAGHEVDAIENLYLDGRPVHWTGDGAGWSVRNGVGFGGGGDNKQYLGPNGVYYQFADGRSGHSGVYCEARFGDQPAGDILGALTVNDPKWCAQPNGQTPTLQGCTYVYLKLESGDSTAFPTFPPEIKFTVRGKLVYDPRTGQTGYSSNPALILADILTDARYGLGDLTVNQAQLIAAANLCDEQVSCAQGLEARYSCSMVTDTSKGVGDMIKDVLATMGGRLARIEGEWYIFPAAYSAPVLSFNADHLVGDVQWEPRRTYRELFNRVRGVYTAANFPYNIAGNLYDSNGYYQGQTQNNWAFEWAPDDFPEFACDPLHGYASDQYLNQDGRELVAQLNLDCVLSVAQAQRLAKIYLLRSRQPGSGKLLMNLAALQLQPNDTFLMTFPQHGWVNKLLEVTSVRLLMRKGSGGAPIYVVEVGVQETDPSVYSELATAEEQEPYQTPSVPSQAPLSVGEPSSMTVTSLVFTQPDATITRALQVQWSTPQDGQVSSIQCQYQVAGASTWWDGGVASVLSNSLLLSNIVSGQTYNVRICSVRANGGTSPWVEATGVATTSLSPVVYQGVGIDPSALSVSGSTVTIAPIATTLGSTPVSYYPAGTTVTGAVPGQTNYVYVVDPSYSGGSPTPMITTNRSAYLGKQGYVLIGTV